MSRQDSLTLMALSLLVGLLALVLPLPGGWEGARPYLLALVLCYWLLEAPERVGMGVAFMLGLSADVIAGTLLGEQALRLMVMAFLVQRFRARLRFFPLWQQAAAVLALLLNDRVITQAIRFAAGDGLLPWVVWLAPLLGFLLWPWLFLLLDGLRLRARDRAG